MINNFAVGVFPSGGGEGGVAKPSKNVSMQEKSC